MFRNFFFLEIPSPLQKSLINLRICNLSIFSLTKFTCYYHLLAGSVKRSVGYQLPLTLDGSDSKDPDVPGDVTGITFQWMCKRKEEEFPTEDSEPSSDGGCWENGTFVFGGDNRKVVVYTGDFYQKAFYDFRLVISKDTRVDIFDQSVQVLVGQPPTMVIE